MNGQNLFSDNPQEVVCFTILCGKETSSANTRVVQLSRALPLGLDTTIAELENRLLEYGESFGSGWDGENKYRVSSFSRFIDAIFQGGKLTNFYATPRSDWFTTSYFGNEFPSKSHERDYFLSYGIDIEAITDRVQIASSDVLIIDNMKCVHSRDGERFSGELIQHLVCNPAVTPVGVQNYRQWLLANCLSESPEGA